MSFFNELKRRNVFRVGIAYAIASWLLLQVVDTVLPILNLPEWVPKLILLLMVIGLVPALIFAWAFELTPEGIKKEKDVDRTRSITHQTGHKLDRTIIVVLVIALGYFIYESRLSSPTPEDNVIPALNGSDPISSTESQLEQSLAAEKLDPTHLKEKSIAVLPFVNMSSDPEQEYFSDGISEEILNALARVKELKVAGRTSSFAFKGQNQDLRQIGKTLGVGHILEGSVRKSGTKVRITAQLIQVDDGFHLWSDTYDRELTDVFAIQDEISNAILVQLKAQLLDGEPEPVVAATRTDSEVYDLYLLARQRLYERKRLSIESAAELLDRAIARDPAYAPAYALRGIVALLLSDQNYGETPKAEAGAQGRLYLDKALQLDPELAEGWAGLGLYHSVRPGEHPEAIETLEKALSINPNLIDASNWLQIVMGETGDNAAALKILEAMVERDPLYPPGFGNAIVMYNLFGMQDKSWALLERIRPFMPTEPQVLQAEANTWLSQGQPSKAIPLAEKALEQQPSDAILRNILTFGLLRTGQYERIVEMGNPWARSISLTALGRNEEATLLATDLAAEGIVFPMLFLLNRTGQHKQLINFIETRWPGLDGYEAAYPDSGTGYGDMLMIALAYAKTGNEARFEDAMGRVRTAHDRSWEQGVQDHFFLVSESRYYALAGNRERAIELLDQAVESGMTVGQPMALIWQEFNVLVDDPRFDSIQSRMFEHLNAERTAMGLEPVTI